MISAILPSVLPRVGAPAAPPKPVIPAALPTNRHLAHFEQGMETCAGWVTKTAGIVGGGLIGAEAVNMAVSVAGFVARFIGYTLIGGPAVSTGMLVATGAATVGCGILGYKLSKKVNEKAEKVGHKIAAKCGFSSQAGITIARTSLAMARTTSLLFLTGLVVGHPFSLPAIGLAGAGTFIAGGGVVNMARQWRHA